MENPISTRRALEVCMARLPMRDSERRWFAAQLQQAIQRGEPATPDSAEWRANVNRALEVLQDANDDLQKRLLVTRIWEAKAHLRRALGDPT
jgi:hypothetical protein